MTIFVTYLLLKHKGKNVVSFDDVDFELSEEFWDFFSDLIGGFSVRDRVRFVDHLCEIGESFKYTEPDSVQIHLSEEQASLDGVPAFRFAERGVDA